MSTRLIPSPREGAIRPTIRAWVSDWSNSIPMQVYDLAGTTSIPRLRFCGRLKFDRVEIEAWIDPRNIA